MVYEDKQLKILIYCCLLVIASVGLNNCVSIFIMPICESLHFSQSAYGLSTTISSLASGVFALYVPRIVFKFGGRKSIAIGAILYGLSNILKAFASKLTSFYVLGFISSFSYNMFSMTTVFMIINTTFKRNNGLMTSIAMCCSGLSGAIFSPIFASIIENYSWRIGTIVYGAISILLVCPVFMNKKELNIEKPTIVKKKTQLYFGKATIVVYAICLIYALGMVPIYFSYYLTNFGQTLGISITSASLFGSMCNLGNVISKLINGYVTDRTNCMFSNFIMVSVNLISSILMFFINNFYCLLIISLMFGSISALTGMGISMMVKDLFGSNMYVVVYPLVSFASSISSAIVSPLIGKAYDVTGNYRSCIFASIVASLIILCIIFFLHKKARYYIENEK